MVNVYNDRFHINLSKQEKSDLVAFLGSLQTLFSSRYPHREPASPRRLSALFGARSATNDHRARRSRDGRHLHVELADGGE